MKHLRHCAIILKLDAHNLGLQGRGPYYKYMYESSSVIKLLEIQRNKELKTRGGEEREKESEGEGKRGRGRRGEG